MSSAPHAALEKQPTIDPRNRCPPSRQKYYNRLLDVIFNTSSRLNQLARLGRAGQWILHQEEFYDAEIDTRPLSRNHDEEVPVRSLTYFNAPLSDNDLIWAGRGPAPDFLDIAFWEGKIKDLDKKIQQVEARLVQPNFTAEEIQTLESLERQPRNFFRKQSFSLRKRIGIQKNNVFNVLFSLARLGRPGQWILHNEELYHPAIDTRPQTRAAKISIVVRDLHYRGDMRVVGNGLLVNSVLNWAGTSPRPDFDDFFFWRDKLTDLRDKRCQVHDGLIEPKFTEAELRSLEAMEEDKDHAFSIFAREEPEKPPVAKTSEELASSRKLAVAREQVVSVMGLLWYDGLPGKWILHCEDLYLPIYDTHSREQYEDGDGGAVPENIVLDSSNGLRFDKRFRPAPDFTDIAYWEAKIAELRMKEDDAEAGRLTEHHFTEGELMRIELLERAILDQSEQVKARADFDDGAHLAARGVEAWFNNNISEASPAPEPREQSPPTLPNESKSEASKTKRSVDDDDAFTGESTYPAKSRKVQPIPEPLSTTSTTSTTPAERHASLGKPKPSPPPQKASSRSLNVPSASPLNQPDQLNERAGTESQRLTRRSTRRMGVPETENSAADRRSRRVTTAHHDPGRNLSRTKRHGSPGNLPSRRSARITARLPRRNLYI